MPKTAKAATKTISALPTKEFFVYTITKDLDLIDAICDLVDNSVDGAIRQKTKGQLSQFVVDITHTGTHFRITDNCGGMTADVAEKIAMRLGRPTDQKHPGGQIGQFGIGMKRAVFKIGHEIEIVSRSTAFMFRLPINVDDFIASDNWLLEATEFDENYTLKKGEMAGTEIEIHRLHNDAKAEFATKAFENKLIQRLGEKHRTMIQQGFRIRVNTRPCQGKAFALKFEPVAFVPARHKETQNGKLPKLDIDILAGLGDSSAKEAGWYINCNGRFVLEADQSIRTGWGEVGEEITIPKMHNQFSRFRGFVFFNSEDPSRIPWNTTKTGIDPESAVFKQVRERMVLITRGIIDFLNQLDAEIDEDKKPLTDAFEVAPTVPLTEIQAKLGNRTEFKVVPGVGGLKMDRLVRVSFQKPLGDVIRVRQKLGVESNKDVGAGTFDYYYKYECGKKR